MMGYTDFHCHLDSEEFEQDLPALIERIFSSGVTDMVTVADPYSPGSHETSASLAEAHGHIYLMTAAHPHNAKDYSEKVEERIFDLSGHPAFIGVGEAGLDFHYHFSTPEEQRKVFKRQAWIASELGKPLIIHSRDAEEEVLSILKELKFGYPVIFHCYTGNMAHALEIISRGYYISFSGIVTFKKAEYLREIVKATPLKNLFTETDSPYLSPEPYRGKVNDPSRVSQVAERIAQIKGIEVSDLNNAVLKNLNSIMRS